jgi:hypothetical protein
MHFKRGKARNAQTGCKLCKPWKANGFRTGGVAGKPPGGYRRRSAATLEAHPHA